MLGKVMFKSNDAYRQNVQISKVKHNEKFELQEEITYSPASF